MNEFTLTAPLAGEEGFEPTRMIELLAKALGVMTGTMLPEGAVIGTDNGLLSNVCMQALLMEAGVPSSALASAPSTDENSTFVAMLDGSIWRIVFDIESGALRVSGHRCGKSEVAQDCGVVEEYTAGLRKLVCDFLRENGFAEKDDQLNGHISLNLHAAICERVAGSGKFIVLKQNTNSVSGGYAWVVDGPRPQAEADEVIASMKLAEMSAAEIDLEMSVQKKAMGINNPFPVMVGVA